jgi:hypothetical protein
MSARTTAPLNTMVTNRAARRSVQRNGGRGSATPGWYVKGKPVRPGEYSADSLSKSRCDIHKTPHRVRGWRGVLVVRGSVVDGQVAIDHAVQTELSLGASATVRPMELR